VLSLLFGHADETFYLRQIVRLTGTGLGAVQRELKALVQANIIRREAKGRQVYYQANTKRPGFAELKSLLDVHVPLQSPESQSFRSHTELNINVPKKKLAEFCQRHYITRLAFFGSVLRPDFHPDSDVDVLVEFAPGHVPGFSFFSIESELSKLLRRKVDLHTAQDLSRYFRNEVVRDAVVKYG
jgi:predicted nucleotidyltransferase